MILILTTSLPLPPTFVTGGSAQTFLSSYYNKLLGKKEMVGWWDSARGGEIRSIIGEGDDDGRVFLMGGGVCLFEGVVLV